MLFRSGDGKDRKVSEGEEKFLELVDLLLDRIAGSDWDTYEPLPPSYVDMYVTPYSNTDVYN